MPAAVSFVRPAYTDSDTLAAAAFNACTAASATVADATAGAAGVMPASTTAAGLAMVTATDVAAQRALLDLSATPLALATGSSVSGSNAQFPAGFTVNESTHATSRRANLGVGQWAIIQDYDGDGTRSFNIYDGIATTRPLRISTAGLVTLQQLQVTAGFGCNGKTPQTPVASGGVLGNVVAALIANGILSS